jgi:predicted metal-dependent hydrolase
MLLDPNLDDLARAIGRPIVCQAARGRGMRLYVRDGSVTVSVPKHVGAAAVQAFVQSQLPWLRKHLDKHDAGKARGDASFQLDLGPDDRVPVFGAPRTITLSTTGAPFELSADTLTLLARAGPQQRVNAHKQLFSALAALHTQALRHDIRLVSDILGVTARRVTIKPMRTLWGSLGPENTMSVNFALIFAPRECTHYIAAHELAHVLERNHSPRFWAHVKRAFPNYEPVHRYLRNQHSALMQLQASVLTP